MNILKNINTLSFVDLHRTAVIAALWSFIEITLGTWLHAARLPFRGLILSLVAAGLLVFAKNILQFRGSLILLGLITVTIKSTLTGVFIINPIIAILMESIFAEILFLFFRPNFISSILGGCVVLFYTFLHSVAAQIFFFGFNILNVYVSIFGKFINLDIDKSSYALLIIFSFMLLHLFLGAIAGWFGFRVALKTKLELQLRNEAI
jgi:hypothetical protein